jgi:hypothetical protein
LKRTIAVGTALVVLLTAGVAYAALNSYAGSGLTFSHGVGTAKKPVPISWKETLKAANTTPGKSAAVLTDIKTTIYGMTIDSKDFPTCSSKTIDSPPRYDAACPKKSLIGTGPVRAVLGPNTLNASQGFTCITYLHVYNAGGGKAWYFFTTKPNSCGTLTTGQTAPYEGTSKRVGKNLVIDVPLPPDVSTNVANIHLYGSLVSEVLTFPKLTTKAKGKTVGYFNSVGCQKGKRPYKIAFTATNGSTSQTQVVSGKGNC